MLTNLDKKVEETQGRDDDGHKRRSKEDDGAGAEDVEHGAQKHLNDAGDDRVNCVCLLGKAVDQVPTRRTLEKGHGRTQHVVKHGLVKVTRC